MANLRWKQSAPPETVPPDFVMPDPTIPWEFWEGADPRVLLDSSYVSFRSWLNCIWEKFWDSLGEGQRTDLLEKAPEAWKVWMLDWHRSKYYYKYNLDRFRSYYYLYPEYFKYYGESEHYRTPQDVPLSDWIRACTFRPPDENNQ